MYRVLHALDDNYSSRGRAVPGNRRSHRQVCSVA